MMPPINYNYHLSKNKKYFFTMKLMKHNTVLRLGNNIHLPTASYFKINGIMCCIVLKYYYLCYVNGKKERKNG